MASPPPPSNFQGGRGSIASFSAGGASPGALPKSPSAEIIMQYWNAVNLNGLGTPFGASVGAIPQVSGLNKIFTPGTSPAPALSSTTDPGYTSQQFASRMAP